MGTKLNIQPRLLASMTAFDLLNGAFASLSGPVGFTPTQPRIVVKRIQVVNPSNSTPIEFAIYKGASGARANGTQVVVGTGPIASTSDYELDLVLDASDFLTAVCISNPGSDYLVVNIEAEIGF